MKPSYNHRASCRFAKGFTLTELLVTIVIIITIAALSFTGISKMRQSADRIKAVRNLSQVQLANAGYASENNGQHVPIWEFDEEGRNSSWWFNNRKFLSFIVADEHAIGMKWDGVLSLDMMDPVTVKAKKAQYNRIFTSFGYNETSMPGSSYGARGNTPSFRTSQISSPERSAAFITATDAVAHHRARFLWQGARAVEGKTGDQKIAYRHNKKAIVAYYDGHVGEVSMDDIKQIDQKGGANHVFWKADAR
jgi:prepilin-type N-terminal cleavage/methylation domain-containing protein/prepilin-type processing-associated H-X9-DG protein